MSDEIDDILGGLDLPSDAEVQLETGQAARAAGLKRPDVRAKIGNSLKNSAKYRAGIETRDQSFRDDPVYREEHRARMQALHEDPEWQENHRRGIEQLRADPERWEEYQKNYTKGNSAKYDDPKFWEAYYAGIAKRDADPEYHRRRLAASRKKIAKSCTTPLGVFETIQAAADAHGMGYNTVCHRLKSATFEDWYKNE